MMNIRCGSLSAFVLCPLFVVVTLTAQTTTQPANTEPLGGRENQARLEKLIDKIFAPPKADPTALPLPPGFPQFSRKDGRNDFNTPLLSDPHEMDVSYWSADNFDLAKQLARYKPDEVCRELERQLAAEGDPYLKLYIAGVASRFGSRAAAHHILKSMMNTDFVMVGNVHEAINVALSGYESNPPEWMVELAMASLSDQREVTGMANKGLRLAVDDTTVDDWKDTISGRADESDIAYHLGELKCRQAVPLLIKMATGKYESRRAILALGLVGDPAAIPDLFGIVQRHEGEIEIFSGTLSPESFDSAVWALAHLKANNVVPFLLKHPCHKDIVEALEQLGDPGAIPAMEKIVADGKPQQIKGSSHESDNDAVGAARIGLAAMKPGDPIPRYCELLADMSLGKFDRREIVWRLGNRPDPRAVPVLLKAIKTDPSGFVVNQSIVVLANFKRKDAVRGLIDCFDANFAGKNDWKRAYTPEMFADHIAESLQQITGQKFGTDHAKWLKWWEEQGKNSTILQ